MASSLSPSAFTGISGRWKSESAVYPYGLSRQTSRSSVDWLGSRSTETICQNLCKDSLHPNWIDKHGRYHTTASLVQLAFV